jgi:hypothetical protein
MINFIQSNQFVVKIESNIIKTNEWDIILNKLKSKEKIQDTEYYIYTISNKYNMDNKNIIKDFMNYVIRNKKIQITSKFLNFVENVMHSQNSNNSNILINYLFTKITSFL